MSAQAPKTAKLIAGSGVLDIDGTVYACTRYYSCFQLNSIPFCKMVVAPAKGEAYTTIYEMLDEHVPGTELTLTVPITGKFTNEPSNSLPDDKVLSGVDVTVFRGRFLGWSPVGTGDLLEVTVWGLHGLTMLDWSSSMVDEIHGRALGDPLLKMAAAEDESVVPYMPEPYGDGVTSDIWAELIKKELLRLCTYTRFGTTNTTAKTYLEEHDLSGDELPLSLQTSSARRVIIDIRKTLYTPFGGNTLWDKLVQLASKYQFAISPRIEGFSIIPFAALLKQDPPEILKYQEFTTESNFVAYVGRYFDSAEIVEGLSSYSNPFDVVGRKPKPDKLRQEFLYGDVYYATGIFKAPTWTQTGNDLSFGTKRTTGIDGSIRAAGYALSVGSGDTDSNTPNKTYNDGGEDSERFAKATLNDQLFKQRTAYLKSSLRFDLAPGSLVAVANNRGDNDKIGYYGTVHTVCSAVTGGRGISGTWVILSNVRTVKEQEFIEDTEHPLYGNAWISAPITDPEGPLKDHVPAFVGG